MSLTENYYDVQNFPHLCRICLSSSHEKFVCLFTDKDTDTFNSLFYADIISLCTSIKIFQGDRLPPVICQPCATLAKQLFEFKQLCEKSDKKLHNVLDQSKEVEKAMIENSVNENNVVVPSSIENNYSDTQNQDASVEKVLDKNKCNLCTKQFKTTKLLERHKNVVHSEKSHEYTRKSHIKNIHSRKSYNCDECEKTFNVKSNLLRHKLIHSDQRPFSCGDCSAAFVQNVQLQDHIRRHHTFEKPHICPKCGKKYSVLTDLKRHIEHHSLEINDIIINDKYICGICNEECDSQLTLKFHKTSHIKTSHLCSECGKWFTTKRGLRSHQELHKVKLLKCKFCVKTFASERQLNTHHKSHEPKKYLCSNCGNKYSTHHGLNLHMAVHSDIRPFVCSIAGCEKSFRFKSSLKFHLISHSGVKKYVCDECGKQFAQSGHLYYHKQFHSGVRPFACSVCDKLFTTKSNLNSHLKRHTRYQAIVCKICKERFFHSNDLSIHVQETHT